MSRFARFLVRLFTRLLARIEVRGLEDSLTTGPLIIVSNHLGRLDAPLIYSLTDRTDVTIMVAEKYKTNPLFRWLVRYLNAMWVDRFNADLVAMREALKRLRAGGVLVMAPEGTRSPTQSLIQARPGGSYLASKAGVPLLPVALTGTEDAVVFPNWRRLRRANVVIYVGQPFTLPPLDAHGDRDAALQQYTDEIMCRIAALLPPQYRGVYAEHPRLKELLAEQPPVP
jgi:1-acyl-sn-glycerol-3-phosphate acyltransferase